MLSLGQKLLAFTIIAGLNLVVLVLSPIFGVLTVFASLPMAFAIYNR
jgi:hypothetical protein